jgi:hypothetical protein
MAKPTPGRSVGCWLRCDTLFVDFWHALSCDGCSWHAMTCSGRDTLNRKERRSLVFSITFCMVAQPET